jgi:hypothetical protein
MAGFREITTAPRAGQSKPAGKERKASQQMGLVR